MFVWSVQDNSKGCVCSEQLKCLRCLEHTAAHTLLSFTNTHNVQPTGFAVSSRAQLKPSAVNSFQMDVANARLPAAVHLTAPLTDTEISTSCQSSCIDTAVADDSGLTPQMKRSRLAQVGRCHLQAVNTHAINYTHTHTHRQPFYGSLDFVLDNPG